MNTNDPKQKQDQGKSGSLAKKLVGAAGLAAATYAAKNPEKVVQVAKKVYKVGRSTLKKVVKTASKELKSSNA